MERQQDYVLRTVEERGVRFIWLWFTDVLGQLKSFAITPAELENAFAEGMTFDGSSIDGFSRVQESDVLARPDPNSFELLPWVDPTAPAARMFCDIANLDGSPFEGDPRQVLKRNLDRARERGFSFYVSPEMEFFYFEEGDPSKPLKVLDNGSYFDLTTADVAGDLRKRTVQTLETMGIPVEYSFHEDSPSQHEIDLRHTDALSMADNVMTFRLVVREAAACTRACTRRSCRSRWKACRARACTPTCRSSRATRTRSTRAATRSSSPRSRAGFIAGLLVHGARDHRDHQPDGELLQAAHPRLRGPGLRGVGPQQPLGARARPDHEVGQGGVDPHRVPRPRPGLQPLPRVLGDARRRAEGHRGGLRPADRGVVERLRAHRRGARRRGHRSSCRSRCPKRST